VNVTRRRNSSAAGSARIALRAGTAVLATALAVLALPGGTALAATKVANATLGVSSLSAAATEVSYTASFSSPGTLAAGTATITLTAPAGTTLPAPGSACYTVADDASLASGCGAAAVTGTTAVITMPGNVSVAAGDPVTVTVPAVGNPATTGSKTLKVATSADPTQVSLSYTLAAKRTVTHAALHVSSTSASASLVSYGVTFASPDRLTPGSVVTVKFPTGTVLPGRGCSVVDWTDDTDGSGGCADYSATGTTATITNMLTNPGDVITLTFAGVTNPAGTGSKTVTLSTTADPKPVNLSYTLAAKRAVSNPFLQLSSYTAGASGVTWSVGFTAPDRLVETGNFTSSSTVILHAPSGTVFPSGGCGSYTMIDAGPAGSQGYPSGCDLVTVTGGGDTAAIVVPWDTNPGNTLFVVVKGVTNPASMTTVRVSTSADPKAASLPLTGPTAMTAADQLSSTSAAATKALYAATFATTGPLTSNTSTMTLTSAGATFPLCAATGQYLLIDDTTGADEPICPVANSSPGPSITLAVDGISTNAGDEITILAYGVGNATTSGAKTLSVTTAPAAGSASLPFTLTARTGIGPPILSLVSTSASASTVAYSATFTVPNGFTVSGFGDDFSTIAVHAAAGSTLPASGYATVYNDDTGAGAGSTYTGSGTTATVLPGSGGFLGAGPGDEISVIVFGVKDPATAGAKTASLSTTSDPKTVSAGLTFTGQTSVSHDILQLSSRTGGASNVTWSLTFRTANGLMSATDSGSTITVTFPAGTGMPPTEDVNMVDSTTGQNCGGVLTSTGTTATVTLTTGSCPGETGAGDVLTLPITGVTNPASLSGKSVTLATSSDPLAVTTAVP
jgi:hypothetical protein